MILAAGRGERMRPLTDSTPKPLLLVGGRPLIEYHLLRLAHAGIKDVVINTSYLGYKIQAHLGNSFSISDVDFVKRAKQAKINLDVAHKEIAKEYSLSIAYSEEPEPLETAGAIVRALGLLGEEPFLLINGDVWTDYPFKSLIDHYSNVGDSDSADDFNNNPSQVLAHLVLVNNPQHNVAGDFSIADEDGDELLSDGLRESSVMAYLTEKHINTKAYTFSGISVINPKFVSEYPQKREKFPLAEIFHFGISRKQISAELYVGQWQDIGTIERLQALDGDLNRESLSR
jgi:MurNAc alpha-1-phosphate uridylyltransferase